MIRVFDIVLAGVALVLSAPLLLLIAFAIRLGDGGPALFRQTRVGRGGAAFTVLKFRTMRVAPVAANGFRTVSGDPRITAVGRILRPSHLDELPQLINVLAGHMSMVGVRPDTPMQQADYPPEYWQLRHRFAPGITGPAQVAGGDQTLAQRSAHERDWLEARGLALYLRILWQTIGKVFARSSH